MSEPTTEVRFDKWLWAARFFKTRALAKAAIESGKARYQQQRSKPSRTVAIGALIELRIGTELREIEVLALSDQRRGAPQAQQLYQETPDSVARRAAQALLRKQMPSAMPSPDGRPSKQQRRVLLQLKHQSIDDAH